MSGPTYCEQKLINTRMGQLMKNACIPDNLESELANLIEKHNLVDHFKNGVLHLGKTILGQINTKVLKCTQWKISNFTLKIIINYLCNP